MTSLYMGMVWLLFCQRFKRKEKKYNFCFNEEKNNNFNDTKPDRDEVYDKVWPYALFGHLTLASDTNIPFSIIHTRKSHLSSHILSLEPTPVHPCCIGQFSSIVILSITIHAYIMYQISNWWRPIKVGWKICLFTTYQNQHLFSALKSHPGHIGAVLLVLPKNGSDRGKWLLCQC